MVGNLIIWKLNMEVKYRIVTNGKVFRIEQLKICGFLWWKREKWLTCGQQRAEIWVPKDFESISLAKACIEQQTKIANGTFWTVVE